MALATSRLPLAHRLVGLRLLPRRPAEGTPAAATVRSLLDLDALQQARANEQQAVQSIAQSAQRAVHGVQSTVQTRLDQVAGHVVELALAVARELVGDALQRGLVDPTAVVLHCLRDCVHGSDRADLRIWLHPDDLGLVLDRLASMPDVRQALAAAEVLPDPALARGAVRAETGAGRLRYDPQEAFERVAAAVRSAAAGGTA